MPLSRRAALALPVALFALSALTLILLRPATPVDETRYLAVAWEMVTRGEHLVPHLNGAVYGHKPPLLFWLMDAVWAVTGVSGFAARLVGPAAAVLSVALTGVLARQLWPGEPARAPRAMLILATLPLFLTFGSATMFDALLTATVLTALIGVLRGDWRLVGLGLGLGALAKGPVVLIHVLPVLLAQPWWRGTGWRATAGMAARGLALGAGIVALWLVPALLTGGEAYGVEVLWRQSAGRVVSAFDHGRPVWFYLALLPLMVWPFGWLPGRPQPGRAAGRMLGLWMAAALAAFSLISGKQMHYLLPELPALALLAATVPARALSPWRRALLVLPLIGVVALPVAAAVGRLGALPPLPPAALALAGVSLMAGVLGLWRLPPATGVPALALGAVLGLHFAAAPVLFARYDTAPIAAHLAGREGDGLALMAADYAGEFNFAARLTAPVALLPDAAAAAAWGAAHPEGTLIVPGAKPPGAGWALRETLPLRSRDYRLYRRAG